MKKVFVLLLVITVVLVVAVALVLRAGGRPDEKKESLATVTRGELIVKVVETGTIDAVKSVEVKSRASGRLARLLVDEGDFVEKGQLIGVIDPRETQLRVEQDAAQLRGARSAAERASIEIGQRRITARAQLAQARSRLAQLEQELRIQPTLTTASIDQARTALNTVTQERDRLLRSAHPNQRAQTLNAQKEAQASYENAVSELRRQQELLTKGYVASRVVENAKLQVDVAQARLNSANDNLQRLESQQATELSKAEEQIRDARAGLTRASANRIQDRVKREEYVSATAEVQKAQAALQDVPIMQKGREQSLATVSQISSVLGESQRQLGETEIRAPISGIVSKRYIEEGELVASLSSFSSGTAIVRIEDRRQMLVNLDVNEIDVARMATGMKAEVTVDAIPGRTFAGTVTKIAPASKSTAVQGQPVPTEAVVKYEVEIRLVAADPALRSGMSAKCSLEVVHKSGVLLLPSEYVGKDKKGRFVELPPATKEGKPERREIVAGSESGSSIEIMSGLKEGDRVQKPTYKGPERQGMMSMSDGEEGSGNAENKSEE